MKLNEINDVSIKKVPDKELLMLHLRLHQLFNGKTYKNKDKLRDLHLLVVEEMQRRNIHHNIVDSLDVLAKEIVWIPNFVSISGSTVYSNSEGRPHDVDLLIQANVDPNGYMVVVLDPSIKIKIERLLKHICGDVPIHWFPGVPRFSHVHLFDLVLKPHVEYHEVDDEFTQQFLIKSAEDEAEWCRTHDKVVPGKYFYPLKTALDPVMQYHKAEVFSLDRLEEVLRNLADKKGLDTEIPRCVVQKKADGVNCQVHIVDGRATLLSESGADWTSRAPRMMKAFEERVKVNAVFIGEVEMWENGEHAPREVIAGYMNAKDKPVQDENITINLHDCVYYDEDIHKVDYLQRLKVLRSIFGENETDEVKMPINVLHSFVVDDVKSLRRAVRKCSRAPASEGAMIKILPFPYELDGNSDMIVKFKKYADLHVVVLERIDTKTPGVYNYRVGLSFSPDDLIDEGSIVEVNGKQYTDVGLTFNTSQKLEPGDIITVLFHSMNLYVLPNGRKRLTLYETKLYEVDVDQKAPDTFKDAIHIGEESGLLRRKLSKDESGYPNINVIVRSTDPYSEYPPEDGIQLKYMVHMHCIGRGFHNDLRIQFSQDGREVDYLIGYTLNVKNPDEKIPKEIDSLEYAKKILKDVKYWKIDWNTGEFMKKRIKGGIIRKANIWADLKETEDVSWFTYEGIVPPGKVGAGVHVPGVFLIIDEGNVDYGYRGAWFHEYFFYGGKLKGRHFFRLLPHAEEDRGGFVWMFVQPDDQTCYVLSPDGAVAKGETPPYGISALPKYVKKQIPKEFRYWEVKDGRKRLKVLEALVKSIEDGKVEVHFEVPE